MKKFIVSILCAAVFFIGLGGLVEETGARFKSDERSLALIKQAQTAIGGETAVRNVRSLSIVGSVTKTFNFDGVQRVEQGELEINMQMPNQFSKMMKLRKEDGAPLDGKSGEVRKEVKVVVMEKGDAPVVRQIETNGEKNSVVIVKKGDGKILSGDKPADGKVRKIITDENVDVLKGAGNFHHNEMFRTALALLFTAPDEAELTYAGEADVDGNGCDIIEARNGSSSVKLFLDKSTHLPRMMSYQGHQPMIIRIRKGDPKMAESNAQTFERKMGKPETAEFQIRFADYRAVGGILLPHRWTQTVGGNADETFDVTTYEINPPNIAEKFQNSPPKVLIKTKDEVQ